MARDSSAEKIAKAVSEIEAGRAWDMKRESRFQIEKVGNVIDATDFAISNMDRIKLDLSTLEDIRLPFETTIIAVDMPRVIHLGVPDKEKHHSDWTFFVEGNHDLTYLSVLYENMGREGVLTCATLIGYTAEEGEGFRVVGPTSLFSIEVNEDGSPGEDFWHDRVLEGRIFNQSDGAVPEDLELTQNIESLMFRTCLEVINMANCANIEVVEPRRTRPERRRLGRVTDTAITHLMIRTKGTRARGSGHVQQSEGLTPLHHVRGHVAHYGDCCPGRHAPRGLLFGKITAKVWVPSHARGDERNGTREHAYTVEP